MPITFSGYTAVALQGPAHHHSTIIRAILDTGACAHLLEDAFDLADHAITAAWPARPSGQKELTFRQFRELATYRHFGALVSWALAEDADIDRIDSIARALNVALLADTDVQGRQPSE
ncbi:hypothetical protein [Kitasatospora cineracea]|uniref:hypothetical protein n=1 Tax=Kitasatospora cineracea TaxID=88074 RepID=UPI0036AAA8BB